MNLLFRYLILGFSILPVYSRAQLQNEKRGKLLLSDTVVTTDKPIIDTSSINSWTSIGQKVLISDDGNYFMYLLENSPISSQTLIVQSTKVLWKREFIGASKGIFSSDSKQFVFLLNHTLHFILLGTNIDNLISNVKSYSVPIDGKGIWLAYQLDNTAHETVLLNLITEKESRFDGVTNYAFDDSGTKILLTITKQNEKMAAKQLELVSTATSQVQVIWSSQNVSDNTINIGAFRFDKSGTQLTFIIKQSKLDGQSNTLWHFRDGMPTAVEKKIDLSTMSMSDLRISNDPFLRFSQDGRYIFFRLEAVSVVPLSSQKAAIDVWNYKDTLIQSTQLERRETTKKYLAVVNCKDDKIVQLTYDYEQIEAWPENGDYVVVKFDRMAWQQGDMYWLNSSFEAYYLVSLTKGSRTLLMGNVGSARRFWFSPDAKYLLYFESKNGCNYFSYSLQSGKILNLTKSILGKSLGLESRFLHPSSKRSKSYPVNGGVARWITNELVWIYGNHDIWQLDLSGRTPPVNLTNGYGEVHKIAFRLAETDQGNQSLQSNLLIAFNAKNKCNGFYKIYPSSRQKPELLSMGPWTYSHQGLDLGGEFDEGMMPVKAKGRDIWIVKRHSATKSPNLLLTSDFKKFQALTEIHPEDKYQWLNSELITWKQLDGSYSHGVLYKPQSFNSSNKYPVMINYYKQLSHRLYEYPFPALAEGGDFNIPWFVSRGYVVFIPDIYYPTGVIGEGAKNSVLSAAKYLSRLPYIDSKRIAISGHSFGGHETYYLVTHSNLFAAAVSGSGCTNVINESLSLSVNSGSNAFWMGGMESRMGGVTIWQNPERYIDESAVFRANKVKTPVLIFQNKNDDHWDSGVGFFVALRRLGKAVWMLQYDGEGHGLGEKNNQKDFTIRITQYFNHLLKYAPAPIWMTQGIPAKLKQIETGYAYDPSGNCGKDCKVCKYWNEKMVKNSAATIQEIERRKKEEHWQ